ncbi:MAG TPA: aminotransferase, partial [Flavobacterium sp.]|nr:aminotransferase [Flavobacterium sp.]
AKVVLSLRNYGSEKKYHNKFVGFNSRLDELQAAFLNIKLPFLDLDNHKRRVIAKRYLSEIKNDKIILPTVSKHSEDLDHHVFHLFVIRTANRLDLQHYLQYHHIETMIHYPVAPHQQKALEKWSHLSFPVTEKIHREVLSLPISPILTEGEVDFVIDVLNKY